MKSFNHIFKNWCGGLLAALLGLCSISAANAQIFVPNYFSNTIGEYNATTGAPINASLVTGLNGPGLFAVEDAPEPSTWALLLGALGLLVFWRHRIRRALA
jgi:hypothetical protein